MIPPPAGVQSVDRALRLLKAVAACGRAEQRAGARPALRRQPQHRLAAARDARGARARRARCRDRALRRRLRRLPARDGRGSRRARPAAAAAARAHGRGHRRDRHAGDRQALRPRLRRPGGSARPAVARLDEPPDPAARDLVGQGLPGLAARGGARGRAAGDARALHVAHDRRSRRARQGARARAARRLRDVPGRVRLLQRRLGGRLRRQPPAGRDRQRLGPERARDAHAPARRSGARPCAPRTRCRCCWHERAPRGRPARRRRDRRRLGRALPARRHRRPPLRPRSRGRAQARRDAGARAPGARPPVGGAAAARGLADRRADARCRGRGRRARAGERTRAARAQAGPARGGLRGGRRRTCSSPRPPRACARPRWRPRWAGPSGSWSRTRSTPSTCCRWSSCAAGERTAPEAIERARALYGSLGMAPLVVRKEIDGFVADRMLEALWREALWLVNDGVATVGGGRRRDPPRRRAALVVHGHVPDLPDRRRRGRDAPLHGAVRAGPASGPGRS